MKFIIDTKSTPVDIKLDLVSLKPENVIKTIVYDPITNDCLLERIDVLSGGKTVILKLPVNGKKTIIESFTQKNGRQPLGKDKSFEAKNIKVMPLKKYSVDLGSGDIEFMEFIKNFSLDLPTLDDSSSIYKSPSGKFKIVLFPKLKSYSGEYINSPCMVGKKTGTIEVSKDYFMKLTVSQRIATLSHEYGHFYKNPLMGLEIGDEFGADLNGLTVYLGSGYGLSEYLNAFKKVFKGARTDQNRSRYDMMKKFAHKIQEGQYFTKPYNL